MPMATDLPEPLEGEGTLIELDWTGDKQKTWRRIRLRKGKPVDAEVLPPEVEAARKRFNAKIKAGFEAYALEGDGYLFTQGKLITEFDPSMKVIFMGPKQQGGRQAGYS
jgi:hypothetical protein